MPINTAKIGLRHVLIDQDNPQIIRAIETILYPNGFGAAELSITHHPRRRGMPGTEIDPNGASTHFRTVERTSRLADLYMARRIKNGQGDFDRHWVILNRSMTFPSAQNFSSEFWKPKPELKTVRETYRLHSKHFRASSIPVSLNHWFGKQPSLPKLIFYSDREKPRPHSKTLNCFKVKMVMGASLHGQSY